MHTIQNLEGLEQIIIEGEGTLMHYEFEGYYYIFYSRNCLCFSTFTKKDSEEAARFENNIMPLSNKKTVV